MATYKVKSGQNIFDVALHIYGSIEGLFDLMITNQWLTMTTDLQPGLELAYHESFVVNRSIVNEFVSKGIVPSNGARHIYFKRPVEDLRFIAYVHKSTPMSSFKAMGDGVMLIDWGDNSELESVSLSVNQIKIEHWFDNEVDTRRIKVYGDFSLIRFDTTALGGVLLPTKPVVVDEYVSNSNGFSLTGLFLFDGTYKVDLSRCFIDSLMPLADMNLSELDLTDVHFSNHTVLEEYLEYIAGSQTHGMRRACKIMLSEEPTEIGYQAINTILSEPEWNTPEQWEFYINGTLYTK